MKKMTKVYVEATYNLRDIDESDAFEAIKEVAREIYPNGFIYEEVKDVSYGIFLNPTRVSSFVVKNFNPNMEIVNRKNFEHRGFPIRVRLVDK